MLTHHRKPVCLSLVSTDLPFWSVVETAATIYQKDRDRFHLVLTEPALPERSPWEESALEPSEAAPAESTTAVHESPRLLWLEISPYRVILTMQGHGNFSYRHFWEQGVYGLSRYWLRNEDFGHDGQMHLRNYTRSLTVKNPLMPEHLRVEYELWAAKVQLGHYVLNVEIQH